MASLNQLVSEIVHALGQPNNVALRENVKNSIIHTRNELIRHSYESHGFVDSVLQYRYAVTLIDVPDGDIKIPEGIDVDVAKIKRTSQKVPRPVRLTNNLPFSRISSKGFATNIIFPYIKESSARFRNSVPGLCGMDCYDYINDYVYLFPSVNSRINQLGSIVIEAAFEHPMEVAILDGEVENNVLEVDDNEWYLPEDMIGHIKDIIFKREMVNIVRETNEIPKDKLL